MDKYLHATFHALGDPTRFAVVEQLMKGPASVSELAKPHPMALPAFTKHLGILEKADLIRSEKKGRVRTCHLHAPALRGIEQWIADRRSMWESRLDALALMTQDLKKD